MENQIQQAILELKSVSELSPITAAEKLVALSALYANVVEELGTQEYWYNVELQGIYAAQEKKNVTAAKLEANAHTNYQQLLKLRGYKDSLSEVIRSLKLLIRSREEENRHSFNL